MPEDRTPTKAQALLADQTLHDEHVHAISIEQIERQFDRVQALLARVDSKINVIFAITSAEIAFASLAISRDSLLHWQILIPAGLFVCTVAVSLHDLYRCTFPHVQKREGRSLVYFADFARFNEITAVEAFSKRTKNEFKNDLIVQTWRTSVIATEKFNHLQRATLAALVSLPPWLALLAVSAWMRQ